LHDIATPKITIRRKTREREREKAKCHNFKFRGSERQDTRPQDFHEIVKSDPPKYKGGGISQGCCGCRFPERGNRRAS
jgi:hypothetical protein